MQEPWNIGKKSHPQSPNHDFCWTLQAQKYDIPSGFSGCSACTFDVCVCEFYVLNEAVSLFITDCIHYCSFFSSGSSSGVSRERASPALVVSLLFSIDLSVKPSKKAHISRSSVNQKQGYCISNSCKKCIESRAKTKKKSTMRRRTNGGRRPRKCPVVLFRVSNDSILDSTR